MQGSADALEAVADRIEQAGLTGWIWDPSWRLAWVSSSVQALLGESDSDRLGIGRLALSNFYGEVWQPGWAEPESRRRWLAEMISLMLEEADGRVEPVRGHLDEAGLGPEDRAEVEAIIDAVVAEPSPELPVRASDWSLRWGEVAAVMVALRQSDGAAIGTLLVSAPNLPATLQVLLFRGERELFDRMARLQQPSRREAAIVFVDLEASGMLARHLPSAQYFELITTLTSAIDSTVARGGGVVGRHAGDGASAFFLADELGSPPRAGMAAIEAARAFNALGPATERELSLPEGSVSINVGAHWGGRLYMGQLTVGRLEVTAIGDEVNECARVQESARGGTALVTKDLLERLDELDAERLGIDVAHLSYTTLGELEGVSEKAVRDAGGLSVTELWTPPSVQAV